MVKAKAEQQQSDNLSETARSNLSATAGSGFSATAETDPIFDSSSRFLRRKVKRLKKRQNNEFREEMTKLQGTMLFKRECHLSLAKHRLAAIHMASLHFWTFTIPAATITMISGIMAFLATSGLFDDRTNQMLNIAVGCLAFVVVFLQTLAARLKFDCRSEMHQSATIDLRDLKEDLENAVNQSKVMITHLKTIAKINRSRMVIARGGTSSTSTEGKGKALVKGKEGAGGTDTDTGEDDAENAEIENEVQSLEHIFDGVQKRYNQCLKGCKSPVPLKINDAFVQLVSRLNATMTTVGQARLETLYGSKNYANVIYFQACNDLSQRFSGHIGWPLSLPNAKRAVDATMANLKHNISTDFWDGVLLDEEGLC